MTIYEINREIENLLAGSVDEETGEIIFNEEALESLAMARDEKIENCACAIKNYKAEAAAIAEEIKALTERKKSAENCAARAESFLHHVLAGEKFSTTKVSISFGKSYTTDCDKDFVPWAIETGHTELLTYKPEANKTAVKEYLKENACDKARITEHVNMRIK